MKKGDKIYWSSYDSLSFRDINEGVIEEIIEIPMYHNKTLISYILDSKLKINNFDFNIWETKEEAINYLKKELLNKVSELTYRIENLTNQRLKLLTELENIPN